MLGFNPNGDTLNRRELTLSDMTPNDTQRWNIQIRSGDFPAIFENDYRNGMVNLQIVDGTDWNPGDHPNSMLIPLRIVATAVNDGTQVCYYQERFEAHESSQLSAKIQARIIISGDQKMIDNPHMQIEFGTLSQEERNRRSGDRSQFNSNYDPANLKPVVHTEVGENANGGAFIPLDEMNRGLKEGEAVV